jgi:predicted double-glycine peptidase
MRKVRPGPGLLCLVLGVLALGPAPAVAGNVLADPGGGFGAFNAKVTSIKEARFLRVVHQQYDFSCGSAALATLLTYHYRRPTPEKVALEAMIETGDAEKIRREGFSLLDMKRYLESLNLPANGYRAPLSKLAELGIPAIVLLRTGEYAHFVVLKGVRDDRVLIGDPAAGARLLTIEAFTQAWNGIFFVITAGLDEARLNFNVAEDWRTQPKAPLEAGVAREGLPLSVLLPMDPRSF